MFLAPNLRLLIEICHMLGIPLAIEKVEGPAMVLDFLGIVLDTERMEARLPKDKLERIQLAIQEWLHKKGNSFLSRCITTRSKGCLSWPYVCQSHVYCGSKGTGTRLFHAFE